VTEREPNHLYISICHYPALGPWTSSSYVLPSLPHQIPRSTFRNGSSPVGINITPRSLYIFAPSPTSHESKPGRNKAELTVAPLLPLLFQFRGRFRPRACLLKQSSQNLTNRAKKGPPSNRISPLRCIHKSKDLGSKLPDSLPCFPFVVQCLPISYISFIIL